MFAQSAPGAVRWLLGLAALFVCAGGLGAQAVPDNAAVVKILTGRVDVLKDSTPWALSVGDSVKPKQVITTGDDGYAQFQLNDGSTFELFPNSQVTFRDNFSNWQDIVEVWLGRIKVHIQKLSGGRPNPARVRTPTAVISVKGTVFHVAVEDDGGTTYVMVEEGLVGVDHKILPGREILLNPGEAVRVYKNQPLAARLVDKGAVAQNTARSATQLLYEILLRRRAGGAGPGTTPVPGGGGVPTDSKDPGSSGPPATAPPPPPPPPPPPL